MLRDDSVKSMMKGKTSGFSYRLSHPVTKKIWTIPYCVPLDQMYLTCHCSKVFKQDAGQAASAHLKLCKGIVDADDSLMKSDKTATIEISPKTKQKRIQKMTLQNKIDAAEYEKIERIEYGSEEYKNLLVEPKFFSCAGHLHLRMHPDMSAVACICGSLHSFITLSIHMKTCKYLERFLKSHGKYKPVQSVTTNLEPAIRVYESKVDEVVKWPVDQLTLKYTDEGDYNIYDPLGDSSALFFLPRVDKTIHRHMHELQLLLTNNWIEITEKVAKPPKSLAEDEWGANLIQSDRYEIRLNFKNEGATQAGSYCWQDLCTTYAFDNKKMDDILKYATVRTQETMGSYIFRGGKIATPAIIFHMDKDDQTFHIDNMGSNSKQFGMVMSHGVSTTKICKPAAKKEYSKIDSCKSISKLLEKGPSLIEGCEWLAPCKELVETISNLQKESKAAVSIRSGYGELFRIGQSKQKLVSKNKSTETDFDWKAYSILDAPIGTHYMIDGGLIHAGAGATNRDVRIMLFWTWNELDCKEYDTDEQTTKLTLVIQIAKDAWPNLINDNLRTEMIRLIYYCFVTCDPGYQKSAASTFGNYPQIKEMVEGFFKIKDVKRGKKGIGGTIDKMCEQFGKKENLWDGVDS